MLDGNSEIVAHVWRDLDDLICFKDLLRSKVVTNLIFFSLELRNMFCVPSNKSTMKYLYDYLIKGYFSSSIKTLSCATSDL